MKVQEILAHKGNKVVTIRPDATVSTAVHRMALERIGALVVSEDGRSIQGVLSERDIIRALADEGAEVLAPDRRVRDLMTRGVRTCRPDDTVKAVMAEMTRHRFRHLPVVEGTRLIGLISIGDVVKTRLDEMELETVVLREAYIAGH
jgi:CBS domain-containing protein